MMHFVIKMSAVLMLTFELVACGAPRTVGDWRADLMAPHAGLSDKARCHQSHDVRERTRAVVVIGDNGASSYSIKEEMRLRCDDWSTAGEIRSRKNRKVDPPKAQVPATAPNEY